MSEREWSRAGEWRGKEGAITANKGSVRGGEFSSQQFSRRIRNHLAFIVLYYIHIYCRNHFHSYIILLDRNSAKVGNTRGRHLERMRGSWFAYVN